MQEKWEKYLMNIWYCQSVVGVHWYWQFGHVALWFHQSLLWTLKLLAAFWWWFDPALSHVPYSCSCYQKQPLYCELPKRTQPPVYRFSFSLAEEYMVSKYHLVMVEMWDIFILFISWFLKLHIVEKSMNTRWADSVWTLQIITLSGLWTARIQTLWVTCITKEDDD